jgi:hypothetical protein
VATFDQHAYYRSTVLPQFNQYCGYACLSQLHYWLKVEHIPPSLWVWQDGKLVPPSSADLSVEQFSDFLEAVLMHAGEWQILIDPPRGSE